MRLFIYFIVLGCGISYANNTYSQTTTLSINVKDKTVGEVFSEIEENSEYVFFFYVDVLDTERKVSLKLKNQKIDVILDKLFEDTNIAYTISDRQIIISKKPEEANRLQASLPPLRGLEAQQTITVTGKVMDEEGLPLPGVTITVKGTTRGVASDSEGQFSIAVPDRNAMLVFTFIGFTTFEQAVGDQTSMNITLHEEIAEIGEVTVVAFGKQKRESVIGAISTISPSDLKIPSSNLTNSLAGRVAGVISYQRSGEPGQDNAEFFIRGVMTFGYKVDPLILIDNVEVTTTDLARLQPDDIASFSIMKDATATALYGARGANGVILVTTKSGKEGKAKVSVRYENSLSQPTRNIEFTDPITYMQLHNEAAMTRNPLAPLPYSQRKIDNTIAGTNQYVYPTTDWRRELMKDYTMNQRANLSVSGGGPIARYYVAGGFSNDNGIMNIVGSSNFNNNIKLRTYSLRSNVNINLTKSTELIVRLNGSFDDYIGPLQGGKVIYNMVVRSNPVLFPSHFPASQNPMVQHIMFGNAESETGGYYMNPYAELVRGYKEYSRSNMLAQLEFNQNLSMITEGLSFRALMNTNRNSYFDVNRFYRPFFYAVSSYDRMKDQYRLMLLNEDYGSESLLYSEGPKEVVSIFYLESAINYNRIFADKHAVSGLLVYTMRQQLEANAGSLQLSLPSRNLGFAGRATYSYDSRYFAEFNFGYNGSERFSLNNRFGFFPSAGLAWSISNESFWEPFKKTVNSLRLRATYGLVGNDAIGDKNDRFYYLSNVIQGTGAKFGTEYSYSKNGITLTRYANEAITWEISEKSNVALEIGLFNKLKIEAEYFNEYRRNILMTRADIPASMGLAAQMKANVGEASGKGMDISMDYQHFINNRFWIQGRGNFTYSTNRYEVYEEPEYDEPWRSRVGYPLRTEWLYVGERLFVDDYEVANSPVQFGDYRAGDIKFRDINGDGRITDADRVPAGYPTVPEVAYGFGISSGYKNWDFSTFFQGTARVSFRMGVIDTAPFLDNYNYTFDGTRYRSNNQMLKSYADSYWSEDNRNLYALWPRLSTTIIDNNTQPTTWFQQNGGFLRLKQIELGYSFTRFAEKHKMSNLRLYINSTNLFCWSKFKIWDPEMGAEGLGYPVQRVFNVGLYVSFN